MDCWTQKNLVHSECTVYREGLPERSNTHDSSRGASVAEAARRKNCKLWDETSATYRRYDDLGKKPPSQYLALQQLKYRAESNVPILVAVAAPAGYGKSEIIMAWLTYQQTQNSIPNWAVLEVTGVAASNAGGTTVHAFFRLRKNAPSAIFKDP